MIKSVMESSRNKRPKMFSWSNPAVAEEEPSTKTFVLGSKEEVSYDRDVGLFATLLVSYNNHWFF